MKVKHKEEHLEEGGEQENRQSVHAQSGRQRSMPTYGKSFAQSQGGTMFLFNALYRNWETRMTVFKLVIFIFPLPTLMLYPHLKDEYPELAELALKLASIAVVIHSFMVFFGYIIFIVTSSSFVESYY